MNSRPLVTFGIMFHNQVQFVRAALQGAFAQTYEPMEIVISDDASTDGSWQLIQELVESYRQQDKGGGHSVILNRNEPNLGRLGNRLKVFELAHGELVVNADGDDISLPHRVEAIVTSWINDGCKAAALANGAIRVTPSGRRTLGSLSEGFIIQTPVGALATFRREVFTHFGPAIDGTLFDDGILGYRARLLGDVKYVPDPLVYYRVGAGVSSGVLGYRRQMAKLMRMWLRSVDQMRSDFNYVRAEIGEERYQREIDALNDGVQHIAACVDLWDGSNFSIRFKAYKKMMTRPVYRPHNLFLLVLLLPRNFSAFLLDVFRVGKFARQYITGERVV